MDTDRTTEDSREPPLPPLRSTFVTVVAWLFIVGSGFALCISVLQAIMFVVMVPESNIWSNPQAMRGIEKMPALFQFMMRNILAFMIAFWLLIACTFVASIGLLWRRNWARLYFIAILSFGIVWMLGGLALQYTLMSSLSEFTSNAPKEFGHQFETMRTMMLVFNVVYTLVFAAVFGWLIKRICSKAVRSEFGVP